MWDGSGLITIYHVLLWPWSCDVRTWQTTWTPVARKSMKEQSFFFIEDKECFERVVGTRNIKRVVARIGVFLKERSTSCCTRFAYAWSKGATQGLIDWFTLLVNKKNWKAKASCHRPPKLKKEGRNEHDRKLINLEGFRPNGLQHIMQRLFSRGVAPVFLRIWFLLTW